MPRPSPKSPERRIHLEELAWSPQDFAFNQASVVLGLTEEVIDDMTPDEMRRVAALVEVISATVVRLSDTEVSTMSRDALLHLDTYANTQPGGGTRFLQDFAHQIQVDRALQDIQQLDGEVPAANGTSGSADTIYVRALQDFCK